MRIALFLTLGAGLFGQFVTIQSSDTPAGSLTQINKKMASQVNAGVPGGSCTAGLDTAVNSLIPSLYICPAGSWVLYSPATLLTPRAINGTNFDGSAAITVTASLPANPSPCAAGQYVSDIAADGTLTCAQIAFTQLSGAATDAQVPDSITVTLAATATALAANPADCAANNFATTIAANGDLTCAQPSISAGVSGLAANVATALATPSSANLLAALTDETGTGAAVFGTSPAITTPAITGLPTGSGVASAATASTLMSRDANANASANSFIYGYATTATAAGTTTLTVASANQQFFTGSTTQTVTLPVTSTMVLGQRYVIQNNSTGVVTVQSSGANTVTALPTLTSATFTVVLTSGTTAASWSSNYVAAGGGGGSPGGSGTELQYRSGASTFGGLENSSRPNSGEFSLATVPAAATTQSVFHLGSSTFTGGTASGTLLTMNKPGANTADFVNLLSNGTSIFRINSSGALTIGNSANILLSGGNVTGGTSLRIIGAGSGGVASTNFVAISNTTGGTSTNQLRINADQKAVMIGQTVSTTSLSDTTLYISDRTATTGVTRTMSEAGAGQSTTPMEEWRSYHATPGSGTLIMSIAGDALPQWGTLAEPTCNSANRGKLVMVQGGAGVLDTFRICRKDAADAYAYVSLY